MQTFLPYPDFAESAAVLDQARLGKQRVETLQTLRALVLPDYGWQRHPAIRMWMGYIPALTHYGLAMVDEWRSRGHADSTAALIAEFAPTTAEPPMPPWLGDPDFHLSHQSNLLQKFPSYYSERFPGVPKALPYVWPEPDREVLPSEPAGKYLWIWRGSWEEENDDGASLHLPEHPPPKQAVRKWARQYAAFTDQLREGDAAAVVLDAGTQLKTGILGPLRRLDDDDTLAVRSVTFTGELARADFPVPALLQDPRRFFAVPEPVTPHSSAPRP